MGKGARAEGNQLQAKASRRRIVLLVVGERRRLVLFSFVGERRRLVLFSFVGGSLGRCICEQALGEEAEKTMSLRDLVCLASS